MNKSAYYNVPLTTKETQEVSLNILKKVAEICEKNNFRYFLAYGTLIGAIRHHGYIPWDDDTDIIMPRLDYEKLLNYLKRHKSSILPLKVYNPETCSKYPYMITRISNSDYYVKTENEDDYGLGVFIDIYPFDGLGKTLSSAKRNEIHGDLLSSLCFQATRKRYVVGTTQTLVKRILKFPAFLVAKLIGKNYFQKKLKELANKADFEKSEYVGCIVWASGGGTDIFKRSWFDNYKMINFENYQFRIPTNFDKVLTHFYGDYMTLPPKKERIGHHYYKAYRK